MLKCADNWVHSRKVYSCIWKYVSFKYSTRLWMMMTTNRWNLLVGHQCTGQSRIWMTRMTGSTNSGFCFGKRVDYSVCKFYRGSVYTSSKGSTHQKTLSMKRLHRSMAVSSRALSIKGSTHQMVYPSMALPNQKAVAYPRLYHKRVCPFTALPINNYSNQEI